MQHRRRIATVLIIAAAALAPACSTLPDVKPFADATASLSSVAGQHYADVDTDLQTLEPREPRQVWIPDGVQETEAQAKARAIVEAANEAGATAAATLQKHKAAFAQTRKSLDRLFAAMTTYSGKLAELVDAGSKGGEAAASLLDSVQGFAALAGVAGPIVGESVAAAFKAIADEFTKMQARKSLAEAIAAADPGVQQVAVSFETIYGEALPRAASAIRENHKRLASAKAGHAVLGFRARFHTAYDAYYHNLLGLLPREDEVGPWQGFCGGSVGECRPLFELQAVALFEERMKAIEPLTQRYDEEIARIDRAYRDRLRTSNAVVRAVRAWAQEHRKLQGALADGSDIDAYALLAAIEEIRAALDADAI